VRVATIDIGTNSVLLLIAEGDGAHPESLVPVHEASTITRLGQGVDKSRQLHPDAVKRTIACLQDYAQAIRQHDASRLDVVSTSAARDASGVEGFLASAEAVLGMRPRVISGEQEARLTFRGALTGLSVSGTVAVFDIGGGSTEVVIGTCGTGRLPAVHSATSVDLGCVRLTERHLHSDPPTSDEIAQGRDSVERAFSGLRIPDADCTWIGIGGTITTLMAVEMGLSTYDAKRVHGARMSRNSVVALRRRLSALALAERRGVDGLEPKRADVIVAGALLVEGLLSLSGGDDTLVSDRGVRWGLALELCSPTLGGVLG
jgi:exopolyphosphatase / guanosine-5'-triphosphate,3'-diphosphate pyrophosphatase